MSIYLKYPKAGVYWHTSLTWIFVWSFFFLFYNGDVARVSIRKCVADVIFNLTKEKVESIFWLLSIPQEHYWP